MDGRIGRMEVVAEIQESEAGTERRPAFRPQVVVTLSLLTVARGQLKVLAVPVGPGAWSLPSCTPRPAQSLDDAAKDEVRRLAGKRASQVEQLFTASVVDAEAVGPLVEVSYLGLVAEACGYPAAGVSQAGPAWWPVAVLPSLLPNHGEAVRTAHQRLRDLLVESPVAAQLLPAEFTLSDLQQLYETVQERELDKRNFRKWVLASGFVEPTSRERRDGAHRPARLYRFRG